MRATGVLALLSAAALLPGCRGPDPSPSPSARPLTVLMGADIPSLDPHATFDDTSSVVLVNIYEGLVRFDRSFRLAPALALRWINPDDNTWRFFLDPAARFSDGTPLRAADVRFSIGKARTAKGSQLTGFVRHVSDVRVVDDHTVDVQTVDPVAILNDLAFVPIVPERPVRPPADGEATPGTGPYRLERWDKGRRIVLERNEHRAVPPESPRVDITLRPDGEVLEEMLRVRPDLTLYLSRRHLGALAQPRAAGLEVRSTDALAVYYLTLNLAPRLPGGRGPNPLRDRRVREALALAIDREELVREGLRGFARPATQLVAPVVFGYDPDLVPPGHDLAAARARLLEAGAGAIDLPLHTVNSGTHAVEKLLVAQWARAGIRSHLVQLPPDALDAALFEAAFGLAIQGYGCTSGDASEILTFCLHSRDAARGYGVGNYGRFRHPEMDRLAEENLHLFDPLARRSALRRALRIAAEELPFIPLVTAQDVYVVSTGLDWTPRPSGEVRLDEMRRRRPPAEPR